MTMTPNEQLVVDFLHGWGPNWEGIVANYEKYVADDFFWFNAGLPECHSKAQGMEFAMDFAVQCAPDHPWVEEHPHWFKRRPDGTMSVVLDGIRRSVAVLDYGSEMAVYLDGENWRMVEIDPLATHEADDPAAGRLTAPMPGRVTQLLVRVGDIVRRGEPLMIIEAMKMEHTVAAPADGVIETVRFGVGDLVEEGTELIALAAPEPENPG